MVSSLEKLSVYDLNVVMRAIDVLADDLDLWHGSHRLDPKRGIDSNAGFGTSEA